MRLRVNHEKERETGKQHVNFDAYLYSQEEVDKAIVALQAIKTLLPEKDYTE